MTEKTKIWIEHKSGRKTQYEATSFTIEYGSLVLWMDDQRVAVTAKGLWKQAAYADWLEVNGPKE